MAGLGMRMVVQNLKYVVYRDVTLWFRVFMENSKNLFGHSHNIINPTELNMKYYYREIIAEKYNWIKLNKNLLRVYMVLYETTDEKNRGYQNVFLQWAHDKAPTVLKVGNSLD